MMAETRTILQRGIARGEVRPDIDVGSAATLVGAPLVYRLPAESHLPNARLRRRGTDEPPARAA